VSRAGAHGVVVQVVAVKTRPSVDGAAIVSDAALSCGHTARIRYSVHAPVVRVGDRVPCFLCGVAERAGAPVADAGCAVNMLDGLAVIPLGSRGGSVH
jgi:hypothetical protein